MERYKRTLTDKLSDWYERHLNDYEYAVWEYTMDHRSHPKLRAFVDEVNPWSWWRVKEIVGTRICKLRGQHVWGDDTGYAGPDSGAVEMECKCCGYGFRNVLY